MIKIVFTVPGDPRGEPRKRVRVVTGKGRPFAMHYPEKRAAEYRALVQEYAREAQQDAGLQIIDGPTYVVIQAAWSLPKSKWKKRNQVQPSWRTAKPDPDNVAKLVLDALNGVIWIDDACVSRLDVIRLNSAQGEPGYLRVTISGLVDLTPADGEA